MKKYFLALFGLFVFLVFPNNAYAIATPTHMCNATYENGFSCNANVIEQTWFGSIPVYTTTNFEYSFFGSTDPLPYGVSVYWQNANWCPDEGMVISGSVYAGEALFNELAFNTNVIITTSNSNKTFNCTTRDINDLEQYFECSVPNGSGSVNLGFVYIGQPVRQYSTQMAISKNLQVSCNPNNASIINNQNQNTQSIINNQNQNVASLITNMTSQIQNVIRESQSNTQYLINTTQQTTQAVNETNATMKDDNIDNTYQNSTLDNLNSQMASNNVISDLLLLPVRMYQKILDSLGSNSCTPYNLGSLYGTDLVLPCIQVQNYIGNALWTTIDLIFCGMFILVIRKKFVDIFNNMTNLKDGGNEIE